jgi:hypothetical protein
MKIGMLLKCALVALALLFFFAWITMLLWNWLVPVLFTGPAISYYQALGLLALTKILFFGIGGRRSCQTDVQQHWKYKFNQKISSLSPEEREAFKRKMKDKWCSPAPGEEIKDSRVAND